MPLNRVVAVATAVLNLIGGLLPVIAQTNWQSTAGILVGLVAVNGVVIKWLDGWQKHEARLPAVPGPRRVAPRTPRVVK